MLQKVLLSVEKDSSEMKLVDLRTDLPVMGKNQIYFPESWLREHLEKELDCDQPVNAFQIDPVEGLIRKLRNELILLRSEVRSFQ